LSKDKTDFLVNRLYHGIDSKQALKAVEKALARKFDELALNKP